MPDRAQNLSTLSSGYRSATKASTRHVGHNGLAQRKLGFASGCTDRRRSGTRFRERFMAASGHSHRFEPATLHEMAKSHEPPRSRIRSEFITSPGVVQGRFGETRVEMPDALATMLLVGPGGREEQAKIALAAAASLGPGLPGATGRTPEFGLGWHGSLFNQRSWRIDPATCGIATNLRIAFTHLGGRRRGLRPRGRQNEWRRRRARARPFEAR